MPNSRITLREGSNNGRVAWVLDWESDGKRKRRFFATKVDGDKAREELLRAGLGTDKSFDLLTSDERTMLLGLLVDAKKSGINLREVLDAAISGAPLLRSGSSSTKTLDEVVSEMKTSKLTAGRRSTYLAQLSLIMGQFSRGREKQLIRDITTAQVEQFVGSHAKTSSTRATLLSRLRTLFAFAMSRRYISVSPCDAIEKVSTEQRTPQILSVEQSALVMQSAKSDSIGYLALALFAGIRPEEIRRLVWEKIDLDRGLVWLDAKDTKTRARRLVHLSENAVEWLRVARAHAGNKPSELPGQATPVAPSRMTLRRRVRALRDLVGRDAWQTDILRHTAASMMLARDLDAAKVALELGNSPKILFAHYRELVTKDDAARFFAIKPALAASTETTEDSTRTARRERRSKAA